MSLTDLVAPILYTVFVWWFSTGAILWLVRLPKAQHGAILAGLGVVALGSTAVIVAMAGDTSVTAAYAGFTGALLIWGWHEAAFLMGFLTGPRPQACPAGATGFSRLKFATLTVLHHEIALFLTAIALFALTWGQPSQIGAWTFTVLFVMRLSAKFNIFLGVPNLTDEFFPDQLEHLKSYLPKRAMNALFPVSVAGSILLAAALLHGADRAAAGSGEGVALTLLFVLTALALIEHAFMVMPLPDAALWRWAAPAKPASSEATTPVAGTTFSAGSPDRPTTDINRHPTDRQATLARPASATTRN